jgi:hypothetical protein
MTRGMNRRIARLEARNPPPLRQRYVFLRKAEPDPKPEPGEQLTIIRWLEDSYIGGCSILFDDLSKWLAELNSHVRRLAEDWW